MSSFAACSDEVFFRQGVESNALSSLGKPIVTVCPKEKAGHMVRTMRFIPTHKVSTDNAEMVQLWACSREIDESVSDVFVRDMDQWRLPATTVGEQCSLVSLGQHMVTVCLHGKADHMI